MRKFNFLLGAISGLFGGILVGNKHLRQRLADAKDAKSAAKIFGEELKKGGKEFAKETKEWARREEVQSWWRKMKKGAMKNFHKLENRAEKAAADATEKTKDVAGKAYEKAKDEIRKAWH
jgi:hypothetical protein